MNYEAEIEKIASEIVTTSENGAAMSNDLIDNQKLASEIDAYKGEFMKQASYGEDDYTIEEKAASVYYYSQEKMATASEYYDDGVATQQACLQVLANYNLIDDQGTIVKEAAESSPEAQELLAKVASVYDDACEKIASAEQVYGESQKECLAAMQVLSELGYDFE